MKRYLVLAMRNADFNDEVIAPHLEFLQTLRTDGRLEITGGFSDKSGGAYVLQAENLAEAQALVDRDPLATSGSSQMSVYEWNTR
ncbi:MAG: YciI family protein [Pseudoxanthomonas sp.]